MSSAEAKLLDFNAYFCPILKMLTTILIAIGLVLGIPLAILTLFLCLPIRAGATGFYRENDYNISGFVRGFAGLCGIICEIEDKRGLQLRVVIGRWTAWRSTLQIKIESFQSYIVDAFPLLILTPFAKRLSKTIALQYIELNLEVGTDNPAFTGRLFGYVEAAKRVFGKRIRISLTPDFVQPRFAVSGSLKLSIYLYRFIFAVLPLAVRGGLLSAKLWWTERKNRRKVPLTADC